ncbi:MAG: response regulator [Parcubacteria group bacterium]|jgi:two-component system alkaline phosphatase synthesis response regulator PhoP/two-component system response regulator VicR|nr:response regulator [Parcubacteria group bacterium]
MKKKILVIDDDQFFSKTLQAALSPEKYILVSAEDGETGLEKVRTEKPDLIVLDLMMPKLDGTAFLKKMQESTDLPKIPVLVSSNLSSVKKISDVMSMGAVGYVIKSDESLQSIVQDIERILGQASGDNKREVA